MTTEHHGSDGIARRNPVVIGGGRDERPTASLRSVLGAPERTGARRTRRRLVGQAGPVLWIGAMSVCTLAAFSLRDSLFPSLGDSSPTSAWEVPSAGASPVEIGTDGARRPPRRRVAPSTPAHPGRRTRGCAGAPGSGAGPATSDAGPGLDRDELHADERPRECTHATAFPPPLTAGASTPPFFVSSQPPVTAGRVARRIPSSAAVTDDLDGGERADDSGHDHLAGTRRGGDLHHQGSEHHHHHDHDCDGATTNTTAVSVQPGDDQHGSQSTTATTALCRSRDVDPAALDRFRPRPRHLHRRRLRSQKGSGGGKDSGR
ncbi:MAG: hypothetical protein R2705_01715 [Ilumatobacteraceae bacterium]